MSEAGFFSVSLHPLIYNNVILQWKISQVNIFPYRGPWEKILVSDHAWYVNLEADVLTQGSHNRPQIDGKPFHLLLIQAQVESEVVSVGTAMLKHAIKWRQPW